MKEWFFEEGAKRCREENYDRSRAGIQTEKGRQERLPERSRDYDIPSVQVYTAIRRRGRSAHFTIILMVEST